MMTEIFMILVGGASFFAALVQTDEHEKNFFYIVSHIWCVGSIICGVAN